MRTARLLNASHVSWGACPTPPRMQTPTLDSDPPQEADPFLDADPPGHVTCDAYWEANLPPADRQNTCENFIWGGNNNGTTEASLVQGKFSCG